MFSELVAAGGNSDALAGRWSGSNHLKRGGLASAFTYNYFTMREGSEEGGAGVEKTVTICGREADASYDGNYMAF